MARAPECIAFAKQHNMAVVTIEDLVAYRQDLEPQSQLTASVQQRKSDASGVGFFLPAPGQSLVCLQALRIAINPSYL